MGKTSIEWCDYSINPIRARLNGRIGHHCVKISAGCTNCYASRLQSRFGMPAYQVNRRKEVELFLHAPALEEVRARKKPTRYFWCDMTDMFLDDIPREWLNAICGVWMDTPQHVHMVLTKRPERMREWFTDLNPPPNVWAGVSVEDQATADERIPILLQTPAAVRFVSYEPALGPVDFFGARYPLPDGGLGSAFAWGKGINWMIIGGESGSRARPFDLAWARSAIADCKAGECAVFMKQLGKWPVTSNGRELPNLTACGWNHDQKTWDFPLKDKKGGVMEEWPYDLRVRRYPDGVD